MNSCELFNFEGSILNLLAFRFSIASLLRSFFYFWIQSQFEILWPVSGFHGGLGSSGRSNIWMKLYPRGRGQILDFQRWLTWIVQGLRLHSGIVLFHLPPQLKLNIILTIVLVSSMFNLVSDLFGFLNFVIVFEEGWDGLGGIDDQNISKTRSIFTPQKSHLFFKEAGNVS